MEKRKRSLAKAISWRIVATLTTVLLVTIFSRDLSLGTVVGITEIIIKSLIYYLHERIWNFTGFGREKEKS